MEKKLPDRAGSSLAASNSGETDQPWPHLYIRQLKRPDVTCALACTELFRPSHYTESLFIM